MLYTFVIIYIQIVRRREDSYERGESCGLTFSIHSVASVLSFMSSNYRQKIIVLQKIAARCIAVKDNKVYKYQPIE